MTKSSKQRRTDLRGLMMCSTFVVLYGCGTAPQAPVSATPLPIVAPKETVVIPKEIMDPCTPVAKLPRQKYTQQGTLDVATVWQNAYTNCANKHKKLSDLAAKAFNIDDNINNVTGWTAPGAAPVPASGAVAK